MDLWGISFLKRHWLSWQMTDTKQPRDLLKTVLEKLRQYIIGYFIRGYIILYISLLTFLYIIYIINY